MPNYNIGAGLFRKDGWINIDNPCKWYERIIDKDCLPYDLLSLKPLPIETDAADMIYSSHVIEHITDIAVENMVKECYRALKPGGVLRITAPDINIVLDAYRECDEKFFKTIFDKIGLMTKKPLSGCSMEQKVLWHFAAQASTNHADGSDLSITDEMFQDMFKKTNRDDFLNYCRSLVDMNKQKKYPGNHCNWWDYIKLLIVLIGSGFKERCITPSTKGSSLIEEMRGKKFDSTVPEISFFIEAIK